MDQGAKGEGSGTGDRWPRAKGQGLGTRDQGLVDFSHFFHRQERSDRFAV